MKRRSHAPTRRRLSIARFHVMVRSQVLKLASPRKLSSFRNAETIASWATSSASSRDRSATSAVRNTTCWYRSTRLPNAARSPFRASSMSSASLTQAVDRGGVPTVGNYAASRGWTGGLASPKPEGQLASPKPEGRLTLPRPGGQLASPKPEGRRREGGKEGRRRGGLP